MVVKASMDIILLKQSFQWTHLSLDNCVLHNFTLMQSKSLANCPFERFRTTHHIVWLLNLFSKCQYSNNYFEREGLKGFIKYLHRKLVPSNFAQNMA